MAPNRKIVVVGFHDQAAFARRLAHLLRARVYFAAEKTYPAGELAVTGPKTAWPRTVVAASVNEDPSSLFRLLLLADALRSAGARHLTLMAPWVAYGRQDRAGQAGLTVAHVLARAFDRIVTLDAHSPAFVRAFGRTLINILPDQACLPAPVRQKISLAAAPDMGASARAQHMARALGVPWIAVRKRRKGRRITSTLTLRDKKRVRGQHVLLVDDMADSGHTLIAAAHELKRAGALSVQAYVTHALQGKQLVKHLRAEHICVFFIFDHANNIPCPAASAKLAHSYFNLST